MVEVLLYRIQLGRVLRIEQYRGLESLNSRQDAMILVKTYIIKYEGDFSFFSHFLTAKVIQHLVNKVFENHTVCCTLYDLNCLNSLGADCGDH